jgi:hypothetical protein
LGLVHVLDMDGRQPEMARGDSPQSDSGR